jgi:hypothetical protein
MLCGPRAVSIERERDVDVRTRRGCDNEVIKANEHASPPVPVVEAIRPADANRCNAPPKLPFDALEPEDWGAAIGVQVGKNVACRVPARRLARDNQSLRRLVDDPHPGDFARGGPGFIGAGIADDQDSSGGRVWVRREKRHADRNCASLYAQTIAEIVMILVYRAPSLVRPSPSAARYRVDVTKARRIDHACVNS